MDNCHLGLDTHYLWNVLIRSCLYYTYTYILPLSALRGDCDVGQRLRFRSLLPHHVGRSPQPDGGRNQDGNRTAREARVRAGAAGAVAPQRYSRLHRRRGGYI